jgi:hypothetical protein
VSVIGTIIGGLLLGLGAVLELPGKLLAEAGARMLDRFDLE